MAKAKSSRPQIFIAILRGINVGGHRKIKMAELRTQLEARGLLNVQSYIQSGNLVFESESSRAMLEKDIESWILDDFGHDVPVMVRKAAFFKKIVSQNPFSTLDSSKIYATVLARKPKTDAVKSIEALDFGKHQLKVVGDVVYSYCPNGQAKTKITNGLLESKLGTRATTRNWRTVNQLIQMAYGD